MITSLAQIYINDHCHLRELSLLEARGGICLCVCRGDVVMGSSQNLLQVKDGQKSFGGSTGGTIFLWGVPRGDPEFFLMGGV